MRNSKPSKIYVLFLAIFLFTDPFILFRVLLGNDIAVFISISFIFIFILIYISTHFYFHKKKASYPNVILRCLTLFSVWSIFVRFYAGVAFTDIIIYFRFIISLYLIFYHFKIDKEGELLTYAYIIAGFLHLIAILPFISIIQDRLAQYTAYEVGEYAIGIFNKRSTGFFPAPGYLIVYSTGLIMIGLFKIKTKRLGWFIILLALLLGLSTLNRSFLIIVALFLIFLLLNFKSKFVKMVFTMIPLIFFFTIIFYRKIIIFFESYSEYLDQRFQNQSVYENDRIYGPTGVLEALNAINNYPYFGNPVSLNGGSLQVWNGMMYIQPHNSVLLFFAFYGLILGIPFIIILLKLLINAVSRLFKKDGNYNEFSLAFLALVVICMIEPLFESSMFGFFYFGTLMTMKIKNRRYNYE